MKKLARRLAFVSALAGSAIAASAQITNTPDGIKSTLTTSVGPAYDAALAIGVGAIAIGLVVYFVRKGFKARG